MESYKFSDIQSSQQQAEFERLKQQASAFWDKESALLSKVEIQKAITFADIGCGPGFITSLISTLNPKLMLTGIDISEQLIDSAKQFHSDKKNIQFLHGSAYETGIQENSQDFVYSRLVYLHLAQPELAAKEAFRICSRGGKIAILDLDSQLQLYSENLPAVFGLLEAISASQKAKGGNREIGRRLPILLEQAGFRDIQLSLEPISTLDVSLETFAAITMGFAEWFIEDEKGKQLFAAALQELKSIDKSIFGLITVMFVTGKKL